MQSYYITNGSFFFFIFSSSFLIFVQIIQNQNLKLLFRIKHLGCVTNEFRRVLFTFVGYSMREERKRRTQNNLWLVKSYELH